MRFCKRPVLLLKLGEQPDVLDGDDGLVREGLEQGDLVLGKLMGLGPTDRDGANWLAVAQQWHSEGAPAAEGRTEGLRVLGVSLQVREMHHGGLENGAAQDGCATGSHGKELRHGFNALGREVRVRGEM